MGRVHYECRPDLLRFGHELHDAVRRRDDDRNHGIFRHIVNDLERQVVGSPHEILMGHWPIDFKRKGLA